MKPKNPQSGQTMIEVIIALFILTMALVAGLSLAIYSSGRNLNNRNALIATALAREGIEVARMFRDTNWLLASDPTESGISQNVADLYTADGGCTYPPDITNTRPCYPETFHDHIDFDVTASRNFRLIYDPGDEIGWAFDDRNGNDSFFLCLQPNGSYRHNLTPGVDACSREMAQFARKIVLVTGSTADPFTPKGASPSATGISPDFGGHSPEIIVRSYVYWSGKGCTEFAADLSWGGFETFSTPCKIILEERLTNWKDYE